MMSTPLFSASAPHQVTPFSTFSLDFLAFYNLAEIIITHTLAFHPLCLTRTCLSHHSYFFLLSAINLWLCISQPTKYGAFFMHNYGCKEGSIIFMGIKT